MDGENKKNKLTSLKFEPEFFQGEVREGFYVSTMMKRYWAAQLVVLSEIAKICDRHGLKWFADCGSLIGAVRHEGFIPWDDDLDICMLREDWLLFFDAAEKELPDKYRILTIGREKEYTQMIGRIVNNSGIDTSDDNLEKFCGCPYTVGIDIFPLDGVYEDNDKEKERKNRVAAEISCYSTENNPFKKKELLKKIEKIYSECPTDEASFVALMPFFTSDNSHRYSKELFDNTVYLPFENTYISASARYDEVLNVEYGDFMRVSKEWIFHNYPVYREQERILKNNIGRNPYRYTIDYKALLTSIKRYSLSVLAPHKKKDKEIIVFLPCRACWWETMEKLWEEYSQDDEKEVHVIPIFYYDCDYKGIVKDKHDERDLFPEYLRVEDCEKFDFEGIHPDKIVIQVPFDAWNTAITVHEYFYSDNLLKFTDELIYIPCFEMDPPKANEDKIAAAITPLIEQPAVVNADRVLLQDEMMRKLYIDTMKGLCGEETGKYWEQKCIIQNSEACPKNNSKDIKDIDISDWDKLVGKFKCRKYVIYYVSISMLMHYKERGIDKIRRSFKIFEESADKICVIFILHEAVLDYLEQIDAGVYSKLKGIVLNLHDAKNIVYDSRGVALKHMDKWDAYYGDSSAVAHRCQNMGIPVMIENIDR